MTNTFLTNLRAARGIQQNNMGNRLPTRGDMQKQRQANVSPDTFINFLRTVSGIQRVPVGKEPLNIGDVPPQNMDRQSPDYEQTLTEQRAMDEYSAENGTLKLENDLDKYNAAVNGNMNVLGGRSEFDNAYGVLNNYDKLNKLLDDYDAVNTWAGKRKLLKDEYKKFDDKYGDIGKWFDRLYGYTLEAQQFGEWDTKSVSDLMRQVNKEIKRNLTRKA